MNEELIKKLALYADEKAYGFEEYQVIDGVVIQTAILKTSAHRLEAARTRRRNEQLIRQAEIERVIADWAGRDPRQNGYTRQVSQEFIEFVTHTDHSDNAIAAVTGVSVSKVRYVRNAYQSKLNESSSPEQD